MRRTAWYLYLYGNTPESMRTKCIILCSIYWIHLLPIRLLSIFLKHISVRMWIRFLYSNFILCILEVFSFVWWSIHGWNKWIFIWRHLFSVLTNDRWSTFYVYDTVWIFLETKWHVFFLYESQVLLFSTWKLSSSFISFSLITDHFTVKYLESIYLTHHYIATVRI